MIKKPSVLLITYYWPPSGGGGVHRWLKMTKYLADVLDMHIYTPENPEPPAIDHASVNDVHPLLTIVKTPIKEPYYWYKKFTGKKENERIYSGFINDKPSLKQKMAVWIRGNFFIPDARKFWIKPSVRFLEKYVEKNNIEVVISTGPPHSMHMIALHLKKKKSIKWIADFRDPWTNIDFYDQLKLTSWADKKHKKKEKAVLQNADNIVTVSKSWAKDFRKLSGGRNIHVITNGYDPEDFQSVEKIKIENVITHVGSMNADRNPQVLWEAISLIKDENPDVYDKIKVRLIGSVDFTIRESIKKLGIQDQVEIMDFIPHHKVLKYIKSSSILLLVINNTPNLSGIIPGKVFEYLASKRNILCVGPDSGDINDILNPYPQISLLTYQEVEKCKAYILSAFRSDTTSFFDVDTSRYSRKTLANQYHQLILNTIQNKVNVA